MDRDMAVPADSSGVESWIYTVRWQLVLGGVWQANYAEGQQGPWGFAVHYSRNISGVGGGSHQQVEESTLLNYDGLRK